MPDGYCVIQVDSRGTGKSPGMMDPFSPQETRDYADAIGWAAGQPWSTGKVGLIGVSYLAINQWQVAALRPAGLAAIVPWEGASDFYREFTHHGGISSDGFNRGWWPRQVLVNQHGNGDTRYRDAAGAPVTGQPLGTAMLDGNRVDYPADLARYPLADAWHAGRSPGLPRIAVPVLSAGNWGGPGVHLRGNLEGYCRAGSVEKWLSMHIGTHFESFYLPQYRALQKRFLDYALKGIDDAWTAGPPVRLAVRQADGIAVLRDEQEWPLARTRWTPFHLDAAARTLDERPAPTGQVRLAALRDSVDFTTPPFSEPTECIGPVTLRLWVASTGTDADLFAVLRAFDPAGREAIFTGAHEAAPVARGWLRVSHRDPDARALPHRPFHRHDAPQPMIPGEPTLVQVEIWPTSIVLPPGHRLVLTIQGFDLQYPGTPGRILHSPRAAAGDEVYTLLTGAECDSCLVLPLIPPA